LTFESSVMAASEPHEPLRGVRVIDLATDRAELTGRILADLGAEVIKVEPPDGAPARRLPPFVEGGENDPDGSLYWAAVALGKRSAVLDLNVSGDRERLLALIDGADVLVESFDPETLDALGFGYDTLRQRNPALIYVSVTPFGQTGPHAHTPATDLTLEAAGGLLGLQGDADRPPVPVGYPQASFHAGAQAAADTVIALNERARSGLGQHLDVSMQAAMVWTLMNATGFPPNTGGDPPRTGERRTEPPIEPVPGVRLQNVWPCADGYVQCQLGLGSLGGRTFQRLMRRLEDAGELDPDLHGLEWAQFGVAVEEGRLCAEQVQRAMAAAAAAFTRRTKRELLDWAVADDLLLAPISTMADILTDPQLAAREYWETVGGRRHPGAFAKLSRTPIRLGSPAPALGEDQALLDCPRPRAASQPAARAREAAFAGLKVADFAWVGVGPITSKAFADHGATVVHVESTARPDVLRNGPPFKDGVAGIDRSQFMANFNSSKLGLALDLGTERGRALARRLIDWADVVVESFTPGTMARWGLDYASLRDERPDLIMLSTCLRGQTGPERAVAGFGSQGAAFAGLHGITGWPDRPPCGPWGAYTDFIAPRYAVSALASAIYERRRSGLGQYIDLSQVEAAAHFVEPLLLDAAVNGRVAGPAGHDSARACPHGVYPTDGVERYIAIAVETAAQWHALRSIAPLGGFADPALDTLDARRRCRDQIDAALRAWTRGQEPWNLARRLQEAGVPAFVVQRPSDLYHDPQLAHRGFFVTLEHSVMGPTPYDGPVTHFSETPALLRRAAPCLGEHTTEVLTGLLGLTPAEVAEHAAAGALS
jgi:crotonobetainyl-CoA:carnitine CoA-transferase CaiB-like acyl-CoA transferase